MTKIDIFSGFLGAGKTTFIKKLINEAYVGEKLVLIENEFGEIGVDGDFMKDAGIEITEMNSGCICCSLVGDFGEALQKVLDEYKPDRILIEPSGVGKLSDVLKAASSVTGDKAEIECVTTIVDANKCKMYMKNFGEFFNNQIENAKTIVLSHTGSTSDSKINNCIELIREKNSDATIVTTNWDELEGSEILKAMKSDNLVEKDIEELSHSIEHHHHDEDCDCRCHEHHHHHDEECDCGCHEHHHHHDEECDCGCHEHHHHHHHADEVFESWGIETASKYTENDIKKVLNELETGKFGIVLRAKGVVPSGDSSWIYFDYIPGEIDIRGGSPSVTGRICIIGSKLDKGAISELF